MDLSKAFSKPHIFGMYYLKNKEGGGLMSGMPLTSEAPDLRDIVILVPVLPSEPVKTMKQVSTTER